VTLVATSNIAPDGLYKDGLQRSRFLPAIDLLKRHTEVVNVDGGVDYRLRALERVELYHCPWDEHARQIMHDNFANLVADANEIEWGSSIEINDRKIVTEAICEDVIWFDFYAICDGPRSQNDYIELSCEFHSVLVSNVPQFKLKDDQARRFINMVDEFYDRNVNLILGAEAPLESLYVEGRLSFEFRRTRSRLLEMQSQEYLGRAHKA
ncbi:MAG: cell division protein ZapE, partial [Gammaproteobacteria bacterium]